MSDDSSNVDRVENLEKLENISEGGLSVTVYDEDMNPKQELKYLRVDGDGSIELQRTSDGVGAQDVGEGAWERRLRQRGDDEE